MVIRAKPRMTITLCSTEAELRQVVAQKVEALRWELLDYLDRILGTEAFTLEDLLLLTVAMAEETQEMIHQAVLSMIRATMLYPTIIHDLPRPKTIAYAASRRSKKKQRGSKLYLVDPWHLRCKERRLSRFVNQTSLMAQM